MELGKKVLILAAFASLLAVTQTASAYVDYDVIVVRGDVSTDYIIASIYSSTEKIPLIFVDPDNIADQIRKELMGYRARGYQLLLIIGGESAISANVEDELKNMGFIVNRLWDWNRYGTAARVAIDLWGESDEIVLANGEDFGGFLIAQQIALEKGAPILFMQNGTITDETRDAIRKLGAKSATLVGTDGSGMSGLQSLGLSVETVRTDTVRKDVPEDDGYSMDFYMILLITISVLLAVIITAWAKDSRKVPMFLMTEDEERLIGILRDKGKTEQNKLASLTGYSKPRISRMLQSLEKRGVIERERFKKTYRIKLTRNIG